MLILSWPDTHFLVKTLSIKMADTVSPYLPLVTLHMLNEVPVIFLAGYDVQAFRVGATVLSHICHCTTLQGSCVGTSLPARGCASSHRREQSYQHEAVRTKETQHKNCQQNSGLNKNRNTSLLTRHFPILYVQKKNVFYLFHITVCWTSLRNTVKYIPEMEIVVSSGLSLFPVLCFIWFCWFWTFQKQNLEIWQVSLSNLSILLSTDECLFIIPLWNNMSVHFHSYSCFTTTSL